MYFFSLPVFHTTNRKVEVWSPPPCHASSSSPHGISLVGYSRIPAVETSLHPLLSWPLLWPFSWASSDLSCSPSTNMEDSPTSLSLMQILCLRCSPCSKTSITLLVAVPLQGAKRMPKRWKHLSQLKWRKELEILYIVITSQPIPKYPFSTKTSRNKVTMILEYFKIHLEDIVLRITWWTVVGWNYLVDIY